MLYSLDAVKGTDKMIGIVSPYSYYAFTYLQKNAAALADLGVELE